MVQCNFNGKLAEHADRTEVERLQTIFGDLTMFTKNRLGDTTARLYQKET